MDQPEENVIHVHWEGPYSLDQVRALHENWDYGVYQIYGTHPIYGAGILLYIGQATKQTFAVRIPQEQWDENPDPKRVEVYIGRLIGPTTPDDEEWSTQITQVENLLIFTHAPAVNSRNVLNIKEQKFRNIHILNWGNIRQLRAEVSGRRWTERHADSDGYVYYGYTETAPEA